VQEVSDFGHGVVFVTVLEGPLGSEAHVHDHRSFVFQWPDGRIVRINPCKPA